MRKNQSLVHTLEKPLTPYFIYGLLDPDTKEIKYIGLATTGFRRFIDHWKSVSKNSKTAVKCWLKKLKHERKQIFDIVYLEYFNIDSELIDEAEIFWISYYRGLGASLLNHESGGRSARGKFDIIETKRIHRERVKEGLNRPEVKAKLSELAKKQWADPEMRAKMSEKININKEAQEKSRITNRKIRGAKFIDDLGNYYDWCGDFAEKWDVTKSQVRDALYRGKEIAGRKLTRVSKIKVRKDKRNPERRI